MFLARVTGNVVASQKDRSLNGQKLFVVEPLNVKYDEATKKPASLGNTGRAIVPRAGKAAPANEPQRRATYAHPHSTDVPTGQYGIFNNVDQAVAAATEAQKKLVRLSLEDRDAIVKLIKSMAKQNAQAWGKMELDETKIGRLDHKVEKLQILELVPGVEFLRTDATSG